MHQLLDCVDAGSDYCPCYLAEIDECIMCSQLQGNSFCDCSQWKGVCIYQEYVSNHNHRKDNRETCQFPIVERDTISDTVTILTIHVGRRLARELKHPGSYVFIRNVRAPSFFDTPMSVLMADEQEEVIKIAFQTRGIKTKSLKNLDGEILVRAPYRNGLLGLRYLLQLRNHQALLVVRGIAQAPALPVAEKLALQGNSITVILDKGTTGDFTSDKFRDLGCDVIFRPVFDPSILSVPPETLALIRKTILAKNIKLVYSAGPSKLHTRIGRFISQILLDIDLTCSNDAVFSCGEGVCGSCKTRLKTGRRIKACKTQLNPGQLY